MHYSGQHRSLLETDQKSAGVDSQSPDLKANPDGSYTVWFAPPAPGGTSGGRADRTACPSSRCPSAAASGTGAKPNQTP